MAFSAKILADHLAPSGMRLTTFEVTFPRIVLAEVNTHRALCLAGDAVLEFDLPSGSCGGKHKRVHRMRLDEFVDKWLNGARRTKANPKKPYPVEFEPERLYTPQQAARMMGMATQTNINTMCRTGVVPAQKQQKTWHILGKDLIAWRKSAPEHTRFDIQKRLSEMRIRQLNEDTGEIQTSFVKNVQESGEKEVYEVRAGTFRVAGSKDHRILTTAGWKTIEELQTGDCVLVQKMGKKEDDKKDSMSLKKINGVWRSQFQRVQREKMRAVDPICRVCQKAEGEDIHHLVPAHQDPSRTFDETNITLVCDACHEEMHRTQGWQGGTYLYGAAMPVDEVVFRGVEKTYDLEIAGDYPNFLANGVVVHNSRNSASSRAIPVATMIERVQNEPFIPHYWGRNQKGMQAHTELDFTTRAKAMLTWLEACDAALEKARELVELNVHKQLANRLLEPFMWHTALITATDYDNFFSLRCHEDAQPEIRAIAMLMRDLYRNQKPKEVPAGFWHLPLTDDADKLTADAYSDAQVRDISVGRCARVSYLTHDGKRDPQADITLCKRLLESRHMSPFEHVAQALDAPTRSRNFKGWQQYREIVEQP